MNETSWLDWALGVAVIVFGWIGKRLHDRVDRLEREKAARSELNETLKSMREDRQRMHSENREDLHYIRSRVDDLIDRQ